MSEDMQCSSCGGFCKKSGCERENVKHKEWVGLPNDEVLERANKFRDPETYLRGVLWAEAKLKEKNT